jgi:hypothetical protein
MTADTGPQSLAQLALEEATLKALLDAVGDRYKAVRLEVQAELTKIETTTGMTGKVSPKLPDGMVLGTITSTGVGDPVAQIDDMPAFVQWAIVNAKTEIIREFVTTVRPAYVEKILTEMTATGAPILGDHDGVVQIVPGISVKPRRTRTHTLRFKAGGRQLIADAWQSGALPLPGLTTPEIG